MPSRASRGCASPGCAALVARGRYCEVHQRERSRRYDQARGSAASRGYGRGWRVQRQAFLAAHPLCVHCLEQDITTAATDVDHIVARRAGGTDAWGNLQPLCHACHSRKTRAEMGEGESNPWAPAAVDRAGSKTFATAK